MAGKIRISQGVVAAIILFIVLATRMGGNIFIPSIPVITDEFGITKSQATLNINLYTFFLAVSYAFFGPFADAIKKRMLLLFGSITCAVGYLMCGLAVNIIMIDAGWVIIAVGSALTIITAQTWIGDRSRKDNLLSRLAWFSILVSMAPMLAPVLGGYITDHYSWRWNFWLMLILSFIVITIIILLKSSKNDQYKKDANLNPLNLLKTYKEVILRTPLIRINLIVYVMFMFQGAYCTFSSFHFVDEMGFSATKYGLVSLFLVGGLFLGRIPTVYLAKKITIRSVMLINTGIVFLSLAASLLFFFIEKRHSSIEIIALMTVMCLGFGGLSVLGPRNSMLLDPPRKGTFAGLNSFLNQMTGWLGIMFTQFFYRYNMTSIEAYNYFLIISLVLLIASTILFLSTYKSVKTLLEN